MSDKLLEQQLQELELVLSLKKKEITKDGTVLQNIGKGTASNPG